MNSYTVKILTFFLSLFILITISSQIYLAFQDNYKTEAAVLYTADEKVSFKGIFVRDETVIQYSGTGVVSYPNPDGSKIAKNSVVAEIYNSENDITANKSVIKLTEELDELKKIQNKGTADVVQPEFISRLIQEKYQSISECIEYNNLEKLKSERKELLTLLNIMQLITGKATDFKERTDYLNSELSALTAQKSEPVQAISVENAGYFVSYTDGYEDKLKPENIESLTAAEINEIVNAKDFVSQPGSIGKIISGYGWKIIGIIADPDKSFLQEQKVKLKIGSVSNNVSAVIDKTIPTENPDERIVILSCDKLTYDLVQNRVERIEMFLDNHNGLKVPSDAIRFKNGEKGVYVKLGQNIMFKKINVIFESEDFVISENNSKDGYLLLYDDIIVEGLKEKDQIGYTDTSQTDSSETNSETETSSSTEPSETSSSETSSS